MSRDREKIGESSISRYSACAMLQSKLAAVEAFALLGREDMLIQMRDEAHAALDAQLDAIVEGQRALASITRNSWRG